MMEKADYERLGSGTKAQIKRLARYLTFEDQAVPTVTAYALVILEQHFDFLLEKITDFKDKHADQLERQSKQQPPERCLRPYNKVWRVICGPYADSEVNQYTTIIGIGVTGRPEFTQYYTLNPGECTLTAWADLPAAAQRSELQSALNQKRKARS